MPVLLPSDWAAIFAPETPLIELLTRGSVMYLAVLLLMRLMPRRAGGDLARMDLVFLLLIAEAATHALGDYKTVTDALIVIATLMAWDYFINAISFHIPLIERLVSAPAIEIVRDGKMLRRNMRREYVTEEELMSYLRLEGLDDLTAVKSARVETEGKISIVPRKRE